MLYRNRLHDRDVLAGTFWGDRPEPVARRSLRANLWRVRDAIADRENGDRSSLLIRDRQIGFNADSEYWLDVEQFEVHLRDASRFARASCRDESDARLEEAVALYRGNLLDGLYDEWCVSEQARLRALFLQALETLMFNAAERGDLRTALAHGERLLSHDPLRETIHRELMRINYRLGDRASAVRQYRRCVRLLDDELGVSPMHETELLHQAVLDDRPDAPTMGCAREQRIAQGALETLSDAAGQLESVASSLRRTISVFEATYRTDTRPPDGVRRP